MKIKINKIVKYILPILLFVGLIVFIDKVAMFWYVGTKEINVAKVVGMKFNEAEVVLKSAGLVPVNGGSRFDSKNPPGTVLMQKPEANSKVKEGRRVYLIVSEGEELVEMVNLRNLNLREVNFQLNKLGLVLGEVKEDTSDEVPKGLVISQSISSGRKVPRETKIDISVSSGPQLGTVVVPNLINKSLTEAERILTVNKLILGIINYSFSSEKLPNTIVDQFPKAGEKVKEGSKIDIFVIKETINEDKSVE